MVKIEVEMDKWWDYKDFRGEIAKKVETGIWDFTVQLRHAI